MLLYPVTERKLFKIRTRSLKYNFDHYFLLKIKMYMCLENIPQNKSIHMLHILIN
jgi:hypothetical protein